MKKKTKKSGKFKNKIKGGISSRIVQVKLPTMLCVMANDK